MITAAPATTDLGSTLEEVRASVAAEAERNGLPGLLAAAIVRLLEMLVTLLADFRAGRLVAAMANEAAVALASPGAAVVAAPAAARPDAKDAPAAGWCGLWAWWWGKSGAVGGSARVGADPAGKLPPQGRGNGAHGAARRRVAGASATRPSAAGPAATTNATAAAPREGGAARGSASCAMMNLGRAVRGDAPGARSRLICISLAGTDVRDRWAIFKTGVVVGRVPAAISLRYSNDVFIIVRGTNGGLCAGRSSRTETDKPPGAR